MATVVYLLEHTLEPGQKLVDFITAAIVTIDTAVDTTDAEVQARGATILNAAGYDLPANYFDTDRVISSTWADVGDIGVFGPEYKDYEKVGGTVTVKKGGVE